MVRQMVGDGVNLAYHGGDPGGGLGTGVESILDAIDRAWSEAGVAILVDLGGAETNSEMAVEMLDADCRRRGHGRHRGVRRFDIGDRQAHGRRAFPAMKDAAMKDETAAEQATDRAELINAVGLHARPSVKLTQLAKTFDCRVEIALSSDGPWVDAKSPGKVMRVKAPRGAVLHVRASGKGARAAAAALADLVRDGFGEAMDEPADQSHG